jgi:hypothetical protein
MDKVRIVPDETDGFTVRVRVDVGEVDISPSFKTTAEARAWIAERNPEFYKSP